MMHHSWKQQYSELGIRRPGRACWLLRVRFGHQKLHIYTQSHLRYTGNTNLFIVHNILHKFDGWSAIFHQHAQWRLKTSALYHCSKQMIQPIATWGRCYRHFCNLILFSTAVPEHFQTYNAYTNFRQKKKNFNFNTCTVT